MIPPLSETVFQAVQKKLLFRPVRLDPAYRFRFDVPFEERWLDGGGLRLNAVFMPAAQPVSPPGVVLYFHGNRGNLQRWGAMHKHFTDLGFDFLAPDYRGYGKSGGIPDEEHYFADARRWYDHLRQSYPAERIVLYGRSLGSGMASFLAAGVPAHSVVLETPFCNLPDLIARYLRRASLPFQPAYLFPNDVFLKRTPLPLLIFHGTRDRVVPLACAAGLQGLLKPGDAFITIEGGSHNNLPDFPLYRDHLDDWLGRPRREKK